MPYKNPEDARANKAKYREKNREKLRAYFQKYRAEHKDRYSKYRENWRSKDPEGEARAYRKYYLKVKHNITPEQFQELWNAQEGKCAICGCTEDISVRWRGKRPRLAVDHDHATGKIRGLLCYSCNVGLGNLGDTIEDLRKALAYLESAPILS